MYGFSEIVLFTCKLLENISKKNVWKRITVIGREYLSLVTVCSNHKFQIIYKNDVENIYNEENKQYLKSVVPGLLYFSIISQFWIVLSFI